MVDKDKEKYNQFFKKSHKFVVVQMLILLKIK